MILSRKPTSQAESLAALELSERLRLAVRWADRFFSDHLRVISGDDTGVERLPSTSRREVAATISLAPLPSLKTPCAEDPLFFRFAPRNNS
jgi:hypothetical protein